MMNSRRLVVIAAALSGLVALAGCSLPGATATRPTGVAADSGAGSAPTPPTVTITPSDRMPDVPLDAPVSVSSADGSLSAVSLTTPGGVAVTGALAADRHTWTASDSLDPGVTYTVRAIATGVQGTHTTAVSSFSTLRAIAGRLLTTVSPSDGSTVGVGETINLRFNTAIPRAQQPAVARRLVVTSIPAQVGAWHWFSPSEIHYRPQAYWASGSKVTLAANLRGVNAGNGYWGLAAFNQSFTVGAKHVSLIDDVTHTMQVFQNDQLLYTWPVSLGKPGFATLSGTLLVLYKLQKVRMDSCATFGGAACSPGSANYYNDFVYWDTAVSTNGFYIHAAPWSVASQGRVDVSHGCINLSTDRAVTFFNFSLVGDVVVISHTTNIADINNGEADWQIPFAQYDNTGNAVAPAAPTPTVAPATAVPGGGP